MLVRCCSFPDKGLQNGKTSMTQRNHRHSGFSQSGQVNLRQQAAPNRAHAGPGEGPPAARRGNGDGACSTEVNTADISELQAVKDLGAML